VQESPVHRGLIRRGGSGSGTHARYHWQRCTSRTGESPVELPQHDSTISQHDDRSAEGAIPPRNLSGAKDRAGQATLKCLRLVPDRA